jgi:multidrug transporter EmrE-like cation transporter
MNYIFVGLMILVAIVETIGDILFKFWAIKEKNIFLVIGVVLYMIATIIFAFSLKYEALSKAISIFSILTIILVVLAGFFIFKENITYLQKIGILLGIIGIVLIEI